MHDSKLHNTGLELLGTARGEPLHTQLRTRQQSEPCLSASPTSLAHKCILATQSLGFPLQFRGWWVLCHSIGIVCVGGGIKVDVHKGTLSLYIVWPTTWRPRHAGQLRTAKGGRVVPGPPPFCPPAPWSASEGRRRPEARALNQPGPGRSHSQRNDRTSRVRAGPCETLAMLLGALRDSAAGAAGCYGPRLGETCGRREGRSSPPRGDCAGLWAPCAAGRGGGRFRPGDGPALVAGPGGAARI